VNPYVSFGLAMCLVVAISLFFTAYLAVHFNRRAKADLLAALTPLNELIDGEIDLEEARVHGRYRGHIAEGRAANSTDGPGKVFLTSVVDGAGGSKWTYTIRFPKEPEADAITKIEGIDPEQAPELAGNVERVTNPLIARPGWGRMEYDPVPGHVLLTRPMMTRRDIPDVDRFRAQLDALVELADKNRAFQQRNSIPE
jgi:hypothetical protein